jgi:hypothetical protein
MTAKSVAEIVKHHVRLTVEGIDRMYLNVYVPGLQANKVCWTIKRRGSEWPVLARCCRL